MSYKFTQLFVMASLITIASNRLGHAHERTFAGSTYIQKTSFMEILGSDVGADSSLYKVHKDFTVSGLRVRVRSRIEDQKQCINGGGIYSIEINGPINKDTSFVLDKIFTDFPHCIGDSGKKKRGSHAIYLNSSGGTLNDGYAIGRLFRKNAVITSLVSKQVCASACAVAFLGGFIREMNHDAKLIFHAPYTQSFVNGYEKINCVNLQQAQPLLSYYEEMLGGGSVPKKLFERTLDFCSKGDGWTLDAGAADFFGVLK